MYKTNSEGPRTEPCGTPLITYKIVLFFALKHEVCEGVQIFMINGYIFKFTALIIIFGVIV